MANLCKVVIKNIISCADIKILLTRFLLIDFYAYMTIVAEWQCQQYY